VIMSSKVGEHIHDRVRIAGLRFGGTIFYLFLPCHVRLGKAADSLPVFADYLED